MVLFGLNLPTRSKSNAVTGITIEGLQEYIERLVNLTVTSLDDKIEICGLINYWKKTLNAEFVFDDIKCSLEVIRDSGQGTFRLRATSIGKGGGRANLYSETSFPPQPICRHASRRPPKS